MSKIFRSTKSSQLSAAPVNGLSQEDTSPGLRERDPRPGNWPIASTTASR
jgi:hypothetical protein